MGLFGGSKDTGAKEMMRWLRTGRESYKAEIRPIADLGFRGYEEMGALLGLTGDREAAVERFRETPGIQFAQEEAARATSRQAAASGMTASGNVLAALQERSMGLAEQQFGTYLSQLGAFSQPGLTAKQNIADLEWQFAQGMGQAEAAEARAKSSGGFNLGSALGGGLSGFSTGGWGGAAMGALGGGMGGGSQGGGMLGGLFGGGGGFGSMQTPDFNPNMGGFGADLSSPGGNGIGSFLSMFGW